MELEKHHYEALSQIEGGADIYGYALAGALREVQRLHPDYLSIVEFKDLERITGKTYDGTKQLPYFGAILTAAGRDAVAEHIDISSIQEK